MHFLGPLIGGALAGLFQLSYHKIHKSMKKELYKKNMKFLKDNDGIILDDKDKNSTQIIALPSD